MAESLFDRVGGFKTVRKIVSDFYDRVLEDDDLSPYFADVEMPSLIDHQTKFFAMLLGGPASYTDEQLRRIHDGMGITDDAYKAVCEFVVETLEDHDLEAGDIEAVHSALMARKEFVVEME